MEQIPDHDFRGGFEIVVEYQIQEDLVMHPDMAWHLVFMVTVQPRGLSGNEISKQNIVLV